MIIKMSKCTHQNLAQCLFSRWPLEGLIACSSCTTVFFSDAISVWQRMKRCAECGINRKPIWTGKYILLFHLSGAACLPSQLSPFAAQVWNFSSFTWRDSHSDSHSIGAWSPKDRFLACLQASKQKRWHFSVKRRLAGLLLPDPDLTRSGPYVPNFDPSRELK